MRVNGAWEQMIASQKLIRLANEPFGPGLFAEDKLRMASSLGNASVKAISYETAKEIILEYEWLGNMGTTEFSFGLFFGIHLAGAACFGRTAGTNVYASAFPESYERCITLCRGACVHWAHPNSASFLIASACKLMALSGFQLFIAFSDPAAGEIGTVYQACNWFYCGETNATEKFRTPDGKIRDARLVHAYTRDRRGGKLRYSCSRKEMKQRMVASGCEFFLGTTKHKYVGIYGSASEKRRYMRELAWPVQNYPKRAEQESTVIRSAASTEGVVQFHGSAPTS